jgi:tetratricopeptide (TPR) repeat protein
MTGNAEEWCRDWYQEDFYGCPAALQRNPECQDRGSGSHAIRGGGWAAYDFQSPPGYIFRSANRKSSTPDSDGNGDRGFRPVLASADAEPNRKTSEVGRDPTQSDTGTWLAARVAAQQTTGDYVGLIDDCSRAIALDPELPSAFLFRGIALTKTGDYPRAAQDLTRAIQLCPGDEPVLSLALATRGHAHIQSGDLAAGIADCTRAIELDPALATAWNSRGYARILGGDLVAGIDDCSHAIELDPRLAAAYNNRAYARRQGRDYVGAVADYTRATELEPDVANFHKGLGIALELSGRRHEAVGAYERFLRLAAEHPSAAAHQDVIEVQRRLEQLRSR